MSRSFVITMAAVAAIALIGFYYLEPQKPALFPYSPIYNGIQAPPSQDGGLPATLSNSELKSNEQVKELITKSNRILEKVAQVCDDLHLEFVGTKKLVPTQGTISSSEAWLKSPEVEFYFWLPSQQITEWNNDTLELSLITEEKNSAHDLSSGPHWTPDKAFEIGATFLHALLNGKDVRLSQDGATFMPQQSKRGLGQWLLKWKRVDSHGYRFQGNEYKIQLPEGYCPVSAQIPEITPDVEITGALISQTKAFAIARKEHPTFDQDRWTVVKDDSEVPANVESAPEVVRDRLIWIFYYNRPNYDSYPVLIDAYTGESLNVFLPHG